MVEISDDVNMINIDADEIKPLAEEFTGLENFFVLKMVTMLLLLSMKMINW